MKISAGIAGVGKPLCLYDDNGDPIALMNEKIPFDKRARLALDIVERFNSQEWQPIETAPKMKNIIIWAATDISESGEIRNWKMDTGYWSAGIQCWIWCGYEVRKYDIQPTHWMPLPALPTA